MDSPRAVFVVGCGRSGTTLCYELLSLHEGFSWISSWVDRNGRPALTAFDGLHRFSGTAKGIRSRLPYPVEGAHTWDRMLPAFAGSESGRLGAGAASREDVERTRATVRRMVRFGPGGVFLNKHTRNARRVPLLHEIFPDAVFLHVVRHPYDAVSSFLNVNWWQRSTLWIDPGPMVHDRGLDDVGEAGLAAQLWTAETGAALEDGAKLPSDQYLEVRYEDLVTDPARFLSPTIERAGLDVAGAFRARISGYPIRSSVGAYRGRLSREQISAAAEVVEPIASALGYALD